MTMRCSAPGRRAAAVLLLLALPPAAARARGAREESTREFSRTVPMRAGQAFRLNHEQGDVVVRTHPSGEARIVAHIRVSAPSASEAPRRPQQVAIDVQETPTALAVSTRYPEGRSRNVSYAVDYEITIPEAAPLQARNSFGSFTAAGLRADASIRNSHGRLAFTNGKGRQRLENSFGAVDVAGNEGDVLVVNQNGSVKVADVQGALDVTNRFGGVEVRRVRGGVVIGGGNGSVVLAEAGGPSRITNSFGAVDASLIRGDLTVGNGNGSVTVRGVTGAADLRTSFGAITFEDVGRLAVVNNNGRVAGTKVGGSAEVRTSFAAVEISQVKGDAVVVNSNAAVTLRDVTGSADVRTTFGRIEVRGAPKGVRAVGGNGAVTVSDVGPRLPEDQLRPGPGRTRGGIARGGELERRGPRRRRIKGSATVRTSFGGVVLSGVEGPVVEVHNQNGAVDVEAGASPCTRIGLATSFGALRLRLSPGLGYDVSARTSFGSIRSDLPITTSGAVGGDAMAGRIGAGGCAVTLTNANGNIEILGAR